MNSIKDLLEWLTINKDRLPDAISHEDLDKFDKELEQLEKDSDDLARLEAYGVDNWDGYGDAMTDSENLFEE